MSMLLEDYLDWIHEYKLSKTQHKIAGKIQKVVGYPWKKRRHFRKKKWQECESQYRKNPNPELKKKCAWLKNQYFKIGMAPQRKKYDPTLQKD